MSGGRALGIVLAISVTLSAVMIPILNNASAYTTHAPIYIDGNDDFTSANGVTDGSGTPSDPYIIEGWDIEAGDEDGITILNSDVYFEIKNVYVHDVTGFMNVSVWIMNASNAVVKDSVFEESRNTGISLAESHSATVENNTFVECRTAVWLYYSHEVNITSNYISNCSYGAYPYYSENITVSHNVIRNCTENAIALRGAKNSTAYENELVNNEFGVWLEEAVDCSIANNTFFDNYNGIGAEYSHRINVTDNNISHTSAYGVDVLGCTYCTFTQNSIAGCNQGLRLEESDWSIVTNNSLAEPMSTGIRILSSSKAVVSNNTLLNISSSGISTTSCSLCEVADNEIVGGIYGISTWWSGLSGSGPTRWCNFTRNTVTGTIDTGIRDVGNFGYSLYNNISENVIFDNHGYGIEITGYDDVVYKNTISNSGDYGIMLSALRTTFVSNVLLNDSLYMGSAVSHPYNNPSYYDTHTITSDNTVNGKPILYLKEVSDIVVSGDSVGEVIIASCENVTISNLELSAADIGIENAYSGNVTIDNCTVTDMYEGMIMFMSENCSVSSNLIMGGVYGVALDRCNDIIVRNNGIIDNSEFGFYAWECQRTDVTANTVVGNGLAGQFMHPSGLSIWDSNDTTITRNCMRENEIGLFLYLAENTTVFLNDFIDNEIQGYEMNLIDAQWNSSYPVGGNYWSDYEGEDVYSGPDQDIPGSDGIGDTPYDIDETHKDNYPQMETALDNEPPTAIMTAYPTLATAGTAIQLDGSDSHDPEDLGPDLIVRWDWEDDGVWDTAWSVDKTVEHVYSEAGEYSIRMEVMDSGGLADNCTENVTIVGDCEDLIITLSIDEPFYLPTEDVEFTVELSNPTSETITLGFNTSQRIGFRVLDPGDLVVFEYSPEGAFAPNILVLEPGETYTDDMVWSQSDDPVSVMGVYTISAYPMVIQTSHPIANSTVIIDGDPPVTTASVDGIEGLNDWYTEWADVTLLPEDDLSGVNHTSYRIDGADWQTYSWSESVTVLEDGIYTIEYFSEDGAGNIEDIKTLELKIDGSRPSIDAINSTTPYLEEDGTVNISWTCSDSVSGIDHFEYSIDDGTVQSCGNATYVVLTDLEEGEHTFTLRAYDVAGNNYSREKAFTIVVESGGDDDSAGSSSDLLLSVGILIAALVGVALALFVIMKDRRAPKPPE